MYRRQATQRQCGCDGRVCLTLLSTPASLHHLGQSVSKPRVWAPRAFKEKLEVWIVNGFPDRTACLVGVCSRVFECFHLKGLVTHPGKF